MKYHFRLHEDKKGFWAECIEIQGILTQADTRDEVKKNAEDALNLTLEEPEHSKMIFPLPDQTLRGKRLFEVEVDPCIALSMLVRQARIQKGLTQSQAARAMGFKGIFSYQRMESGRKCNPALNTIVKVCKVFPEIDLSLIL